MSMKKTLFTLSAVLCFSTPIYADYAYCKAFESSKKTFYFSAVFYTSNTHGPTLNTTEGGEFAAEYLKYSGDGANCYDRNSKSKVKIMRSKDIKNEKRWAKVVKTKWKP